MPRTEFSKRTKLQAWQRANGRCECCGAKLATGNIEYDHDLPAEMGGGNNLANCRCLCRTCHRSKTNADIRTIAKSNRQRNKAAGIKKAGRPMPGSRNSDWKKTFNNGWVKR